MKPLWSAHLIKIGCGFQLLQELYAFGDASGAQKQARLDEIVFI